jgi:hypothetical protein
MYRTHLFGVVPVIQQLHKILDENLGEFPNIDITGTGALTCDVIDEDLETTMGLLNLLAETKLFWKFVAMAAFWKLRLANFNSLIERLSNAR